ncbi:MAG: DNA replication/repair protein RecF [Microgenomates group bacterium]
MILKKINFYNFRNFKDASFNFNPFLTVIVGENARGKTNLLEGIYFLINGWGFREEKEVELILLGKDKGWVEGVFGEETSVFDFKIVLEKKETGVEKKFYFNKVKKKFFQYSKDLPKTVLFSPEQIEIITGSPQARRNYFDKLLGQYDFEYKNHLVNYENALRRRNKILEKENNEEKLKEELKFWDDYLIQQGQYLTIKRGQYLNFLNYHNKLNNKNFSIKYLKNEFTRERLKEVFNEERKWRKTLIGPQRDDFKISLISDFEKDIHIYGSRSEQRMALFWLKVNEINYCQQKIKKRPIILLDDIFSELDFYHKKIVLNLVKKYQTIVTTTEIEVLELAEVPKTVIKL